MSTPPWARSAAGANTYDAVTGTVLPTVYERTTAASAALGGINLGQGFPDTEGPQWIREAAAQAIATAAGPTNQYSPGPGFGWFREAVAAHQRRHYGTDLDPETQVLHTTGATEAIAATILAFAAEGSEVLTFEPFYDSYGSMVALAGAQLRTIPLRAPDFRPDVHALEAAVTDRTSMILVNTPHNPTGVVFSPAELQQIVGIAARHGAVVMADEVYEHLIMDDTAHRHHTILTVPGAEEVAVAIGSAGKSFSLTGWKVGWVTGSPELVNQIRGVKQFTTFCTGGAFQYAVAQGLEDDRGFFAANQAELQAGRDLLMEGLAAAGLRPYRPDAGYFVLAEVAGVTDKTAAEFAAELVSQAGVGAIPVSSLTLPSTQEDRDDELNRLLRFAFCKRHDVLETALNRLAAWIG